MLQSKMEQLQTFNEQSDTKTIKYHYKHLVQFKTILESYTSLRKVQS